MDGQREVTIVFLIDALGSAQVARAGFLDRYVAPERRRPVRSVFGFSSAVLPSIFTGRLPREHGHWSMFRRDMGDSVFHPYRHWIRLASFYSRGQWRFREHLSGRLRRAGLTGYFSLYEVPLEHLCLFDLCQRRNIYLPGAFDGIPSIFDRLVEEAIPHRVWDWRSDEERAFGEMEIAARTGPETFLFLYTADLDSTMHIHGPSSDAAAMWLRRAEERIVRVVEAARASGRKTRLRVFGDHGMAPVRGEVDVVAMMQRLPWRMPRDYTMFLDSSMARFWYRSDGARRDIRQALGSAKGGRFVTPTEMAALGVDFPGHDYGEDVFLCDAGVIVQPSFMGHEPLAGMHGYHPDDEDSNSVFLADPPPARGPDSVIDIASILMSDVGISMERR
jgi:predicted AlkP superfamily pyrophosphatase or phosphodiesterase